MGDLALHQILAVLLLGGGAVLLIGIILREYLKNEVGYFSKENPSFEISTSLLPDAERAAREAKANEHRTNYLQVLFARDQILEAIERGENQQVVELGENLPAQQFRKNLKLQGYRVNLVSVGTHNTYRISWKHKEENSDE